MSINERIIYGIFITKTLTLQSSVLVTKKTIIINQKSFEGIY